MHQSDAFSRGEAKWSESGDGECGVSVAVEFEGVRGITFPKQVESGNSKITITPHIWRRGLDSRGH
jgi:hypothetical protein